MSPLEFDVVVFVISIAAGALGSLLGLGGGIIVIPALTLLLEDRHSLRDRGVDRVGDCHFERRGGRLCSRATGESARGDGAGNGHRVRRDHGRLSCRTRGRTLVVHHLWAGDGLLGIAMFKKVDEADAAASAARPAPWADYLQLNGSYYDELAGKEVAYRVVGTRIGLVLMYLAGAISGLLGIGSGSLKVTAMDLAMRLPIKVSTATSNLMIGVTAAASAGIYFARGDIDPFVAAPVAGGVLIGAVVGSRILGRLQNATLRLVFVVVLVAIAAQMIWKGVRG